MQSGVGPLLAIYLAGYRWNEESVGLALTVGGIAGILKQTPAVRNTMATIDSRDFQFNFVSFRLAMSLLLTFASIFPISASGSVMMLGIYLPSIF